MTTTFKLFVILPDESVCTLRNLISGINIEEVKARLEINAGVPSHIYQLFYPDGEKLQDHQKLLTQENIKDGYILKMHILDKWETLFNSVIKNNIESVYHNGSVHMKGNMIISADENEKLEAAVYDRGCVALYLSSYLGLLRMCNMLISVGVNINGTTQFGRTPLHAAVAKDNLIIMKYLTDHGAKITITDILGKSPLDIAQACSSNMCEKNLKIMQLNLRGSDKAFKVSKIPRSAFQLPERKPIQLNKEQLIRPKSLIDGRNKVKIHQNRPQTYYLSRQSITTSPKANRTVAWVSIQDANIKNNPVKQTHKINGYYKFRNITKMETIEDDVITCKPLPLLRKKSCLKFASDDKAISRSTQTTPVPAKQDISTTPMLFAPPSSRLEGNNTPDESKSPLVQDEHVSFRTSRSGKLVSFSRKNRQDINDLPDASRVMKRRINMVANRGAPGREHQDSSIQQRSGVLHDRWSETRRISGKNVRADLSSTDEDSDEDDDSGNGSEANNEAYEAWLKKKEEQSRRTPNKFTRPIHDLIKIGSTELGDARNPSAEYNLTAYKDWLDRRRNNKRVPNLERIKSMKDFQSQKKLLEEKRQKLLMSAISYDEWMDHEHDRRALIRKILKADFNQLKAMEHETDNIRPTVQDNNQKWQEEVMKREDKERKKRAIQQNYKEEKEKWRKEVIRSSVTLSQNDCLRSNNSQTPRLLMRSNSKGANDSDVKRAVEADKAYQDWMKRRHTEDIQRQTENEINSYQERKAMQIATY